MKAKYTHYEMTVVANDFHVPHQDKKALKLLEIGDRGILWMGHEEQES